MLYRIIILPAVLYVRGSWYLTSSEETLKIFEHNVLRKLLRPKREYGGGGGSRQLHNEDLHDEVIKSRMI
jgi:hypothetical protein